VPAACLPRLVGQNSVKGVLCHIRLYPAGFPMPIPILGEIERFISEHGSSVVRKERLALLQDKLFLLKEEVSKLEKSNSDLKTQVAELQSKIASTSRVEQFEEERGALFKRRAGGGYHQAVN